MMMRAVSVFLLLFTAVACASSADLAPGKGGSRAVVSGKSYDEIWDAAILGIQRSSEDRLLELPRKPYITLQDKKAGRIEAETSVGAFTLGEMVGIYITPPYDAPQHTVEVQSISKVVTNVTSKDWDGQVLANIKKELGQ